MPLVSSWPLTAGSLRYVIPPKAVDLIRAGSWFASRPAEDSEYALAGCTVSPGFDFAEFELADRAMLIKQYPHHEALIESLTR